jgi:hypothetical protein
MALRAQQTPYCVYGLADHLDAILAAYEDLQAATNRPAEVVSLELSALSHALQARRCLQDLWIDDDALSHEATLFLAATGSLMQARGVGSGGAAGAACPEDILIGGQVPADVIADRASRMLDVLEARYGDLWPLDSTTPVHAHPTTPPSIWSS